MWRDWFTFTRQDRRAIILLSIAIIIVWAILYLRPREGNYTPLIESTDSIAESLTAPKSAQPVVRIDRHLFNPNNADSLELLTLGIPPRVTSNILRYRRAGGCRQLDRPLRLQNHRGGASCRDGKIRN